MKIPAYEEDAYRTELETVVGEVGVEDGQPFAVLEDTVLYPEGGGQPFDHGALGETAVTEVRQVEGTIRHYLEEAVELGPVVVTLDWERRYDHMQQHTAQHLLSAVAADRFGWTTTSFHLGLERSDIELDVESIADVELEELEELVLAQVRAARPVVARRLSADEYAALDVRSRGLPPGHEGDVRLVEIEGVDVTTCGGTHLRSTAEIESLKLLAIEKMRGGTRLYWVAGGRVRRLLAAYEHRAAQLRRLFETSDADLVEVAAAKLERLRDSGRELRAMEAGLAEALATLLAAAQGRVVETHLEGSGASLLRQTARRLAEQAPEKIALLTASGDSGEFFVVAAGKQAGIDVAAVGKTVAGLLEGRGGGSGSLFQGKAGSLSARPAALAALADVVG